MNKKRTENGQVLILLAVGMVVLMGFTALAIDGSNVYSDRRQLQNAADAGSLAGAGAAGEILYAKDKNYVTYEDWDCTKPDNVEAKQNAVTQAINRAKDNGFDIVEGAAENYVIVRSCDGPYIEVETSITSTSPPTSFLHFVYGGELSNTVIAKSRVYPREAIGGGNSMLVLNDNANSNDVCLNFGGGVFANVSGGIHSNCDIDFNGNSGEVTVLPPGGITHRGEMTNNNMTVSPEPTHTPNKLVTADIPEPNCNLVPVQEDPVSNNNTDIHLEPGRYGDIHVQNGLLTLKPGLYCVSGNFIFSGVELIGHQVTIYLSGSSSYFSLSGSSKSTLSAPPSDCDTEVNDPENEASCPPAIPGVLVYLKNGGSQGIAIDGTSDSTYSGTVYAPHNQINIGGNSTSLTVGAQLIGWDIKVHGNTILNLVYDASTVYHTPTKLELFK
jgi:hypothetical protein